MDNAIRNIFEETINPDLTGIVISNSSDQERISKVKIRPVLIKDTIQYQASEYIGQKVFHQNYTRENLLEKLPDWFDDLLRQAQITTKYGTATVLVSKKGKVTIQNKIPKAAGYKLTAAPVEDGQLFLSDALLHNKKKNYILQEGIPLPFLIDLGVMTKEGLVVKAKSDKFRQINRFLEFIEDVLPYLDKSREITILDFGCGKSYLTFAMYYYLKILQGYEINIIGLDLKKDVITECNKLSEKYGYEKLHFLIGDIASYTGNSTVDMVVTLHACDTATDHALHKAVSWGARVILSVPCCQHELNHQMKCDTLKPIIKYGIIKERMAALVTDALRAELLESMGYKVQLLEFIDMEHTPKNILIRAVRKNKPDKENIRINQEVKECMDFFGVNPSLYQLLKDNSSER